MTEAKTAYREIVYLQDDDSVEGLEILKHCTPVDWKAALDYLLKFDKGGRVLKRLVAPGHQLRDGKYILFYDPYASHIGLLEVVAAGKHR